MLSAVSPLAVLLLWRDESASLHTSGSRLCLLLLLPSPPLPATRARHAGGAAVRLEGVRGQRGSNRANTWQARLDRDKSQSANTVAAAALRAWRWRGTALLLRCFNPKLTFHTFFCCSPVPVPFSHPHNSSGVTQRQRIPHSR